MTFDLEEARYRNSHQRRLLKHSQPCSPDRCRTCGFSPDEMGVTLAEIERLRAENEETDGSLTAAYLLGSHKKEQEMAARIKELEDALVEERAMRISSIPSNWWNEGKQVKDYFRHIARERLQAEGKIGQGTVAPQCWQVTEERKEALSHALDYINATDLPIGELSGAERLVLRVMLTEAE